MEKAADSMDAHAGTRATFDRALDGVKDDVLRLGARVEHALEQAGLALVSRDTDLADQVRWDDAAVNELQQQINTEITTLIATQAPVGRDVRELLALYHASSELERMGDYAVNIAKLAQQLAGEPETPILKQIPQMERICREQLHAAMRALVDVSEADARGWRSATTRSTTCTTACTRTRCACCPRLPSGRARRRTCSSRPITWSGSAIG